MAARSMLALGAAPPRSRRRPGRLPRLGCPPVGDRVVAPTPEPAGGLDGGPVLAPDTRLTAGAALHRLTLPPGGDRLGLGAGLITPSRSLGAVGPRDDALGRRGSRRLPAPRARCRPAAAREALAGPRAPLRRERVHGRRRGPGAPRRRTRGPALEASPGGLVPGLIAEGGRPPRAGDDRVDRPLRREQELRLAPRGVGDDRLEEVPVGELPHEAGAGLHRVALLLLEITAVLAEEHRDPLMPEVRQRREHALPEALEPHGIDLDPPLAAILDRRARVRRGLEAQEHLQRRALEETGDQLDLEAGADDRPRPEHLDGLGRQAPPGDHLRHLCALARPCPGLEHRREPLDPEQRVEERARHPPRLT